MEHIKLGEKVKVIGKDVNGKVAFIGETLFSDGEWYGLTLDEPIGRHDGIIEGKRYFKCPRNHGVFVRVSQIEKLIQENSNDKTSTAVPSKFTNKNFLKFSHKLKTAKDLSSLKNGEGMHMTETESVDKVIPFEIPKSPINSNHLKSANKLKSGKFISARNNVHNTQNTEKESKEKIPEVHESPQDKELRKFKEENEELKLKLKNTEDTLHDTLEKYTKTIDENKNLREELDNKKKRIRIQRDHLKLLKIRQCNHFKEIESPKNSSKNLNLSSQMEGGDLTNVVTQAEVLTLSEEEFDLETTKSLSSTQRVVELEEQIRIMKQGLIQLRDFLKCHRPPTFITVLGTANKKDVETTSSTTDSPTRGNNEYNNLKLGLERAKTTSALKEYYNMLCEMTSSRHVTEENDNSLSGCSNLSEENNRSGKNNIQQFNQKLSDQTSSCSDLEICAELPRTSKESEISYKTHIPYAKDIQSNFQGGCKQRSGHPVNIAMQKKQKSQRHLTNRKSPLKEAEYQMKQLMATTQQSGQWTSNASLTKQHYVVQDASDSVSNSSLLKSDMNAGFPLTLMEQSSVLPSKTSAGGDAEVVPRGKTTRDRM